MFLLVSAVPVHAAVSLIRDTEIEKTLKNYADPIFRAAGLNPDAINIYIVNDDSINAFVAGGQNLFIHTGLILISENANMLIGVIAHETGHMASGHIIKREQEAEGLSLQTILTTVLGAAVTVAGLPDAGMAVIAGGQHVSMRQYLQFSREQEVEADQRGMDYLKKTHQSAEGMLGVMQILRRQQTLEFGKLDPYAISHPLSQERIAHIRAETIDGPQYGDDGFKAQHERMMAKLYGFLRKPENTMLKYTDNSVPSRYARAVAYYRKSDLVKSFAELDELIRQYPTDPYFIELKGQFLAETGKVDEALQYYLQADKYSPDSFLIKYEIGKLYLGKEQINEAQRFLTQAVQLEPKSESTWRMLAGLYGKKGNKGMMNLSLAEEANLKGDNEQARRLARIAKADLQKNSPAWIRANDILADIKIRKDKK